MKLGIVGGGALGLAFAAALAPHGDVLLLVRRAQQAAELERYGISVEREGVTTRVAVRATSAAAAFSDRDAILVAVKSAATREALAPLHGILRPGALVASLQNGIDHLEDARAALPGTRIVAAPTMRGATLLDGRSVRLAGEGETTIARDGGENPSADDLAALLVRAGLAARAVEDGRAAVWRKLVRNCALNPIAALVGRTNGAILADPALAALARTLADEAADVAAAEGVVLGDPWPLVEAAARATAENRSSMLQDIDAGRPTEIDAISGAVMRRAARRGIAVPATALVAALVRAKEGR